MNFINPSEESTLRPFKFLEESYKNLGRSLTGFLSWFSGDNHVWRFLVEIYNFLVLGILSCLLVYIILINIR